jgi:hypothetical protein
MKLFERRIAPLAILAIVLGVALVTIRLGFYIDDYAIQAGLSGRWPNGPAAWDLYRFTYLDEAHNRAAIAASDLPWWTVPTLKLHLVRPLTSLGFLLDTKVFGNAAPLGWHLHSIAWYLLLVHLVGLVLRRLLPRGTANLAMLIFGLSTAHFFAYAWIACRHMPIAAAIGLLGIHALVREHRYASVIFAACLGVSLLAGETAIGIAVFGLVFLVATTRPTRVVAMARRVAPTAVVLVVWLAFYVSVGGGAAHSDGYVDPTSAPIRFALKAAKMLPVMIANATFGVPAEMVSAFPATPFVLVGFVAVAFVCAMWRGARTAMADDEKRVLPWLAVGAVLATIPSLGGFPGARILLVPDIGFAAIIAVLIRRGWRAGGVARRAGVGLLCLVHLVAAPLLDLGNSSFNAKVGRDLEALVRTIDVEDVPSGGVRLFVMGGSDPLVTMYPPIVAIATSEKLRERVRCWSVVSGTKGNHELLRSGARTIRVRPTSGRMLDGPFEALYRSKDDPLHAGDEVKQCDVVYRVLAVDEGRPTEIELDFGAPLEDPGLRILLWNGTGFERFRPPEVGASATVPWAAGPLGMF